MHLFAFQNGPLPPEDHPLHRTLLLMRIEGWIRVAMIALSLLATLFMLVVFGILGHAWDLDTMPGPFGLFTTIIIAMVLFLVMVNIAMFVWLNHVVETLREGAPGAAGTLQTYGITSAVLAGIGVLGGLGGDILGLAAYGAILTFGILYALAAKEPEVVATLEGVEVETDHYGSVA